MNITYYELSNYNSGILISKTFDLEGKDHDDHKEEVKQWLEELTESTGQLCEEIIVCDSEGVPSRYVGEWSLDGEFFDYLEALGASYLDAEIFEAGVALGFSLDSIEDRYFGTFGSETELGEYCLENIDDLSSVPEHLVGYINAEAYGRDLAHDYSEFNTHYFYN